MEKEIRSPSIHRLRESETGEWPLGGGHLFCFISVAVIKYSDNNLGEKEFILVKNSRLQSILLGKSRQNLKQLVSSHPVKSTEKGMQICACPLLC